MQERRPRSPLLIFFAILLGLMVMRWILDRVSVPIQIAGVLQIPITILFIAAPILALYAASREPWPPNRVWGFLIGGLSAHLVFEILSRTIAKGTPGAIYFSGIAQTGLLVWTAGLGAGLANLLKDKNLLLPVSIFLAGFDAYIIFSPTSITRTIMSKAPEVFKAVAIQIPSVNVGPAAMVGPADFFFLAMFFVAIHKFKMKSKATLYAIIPVLIAYILVVLVLGDMKLGPISLGMLPALLPIGLTVLIVNWSEFKLNGEEKISTALVAAIALALGCWGYFNAKAAANKPAIEPSTTTTGQSSSESAQRL